MVNSSLEISEELLKYPVVREALLYERLRGGTVKCNLCERRCIIREGSVGFCRTRANIEGKLYTLVYGDLSALESRPIEIKPFFHFWPGSTALTFSTWSCNFICPWCQNWTLSRTLPNPLTAKYIPPQRIVEIAKLRRDEGTCVSLNEPTLLFEYSVDVFKRARDAGLYNTYVSNGYMTLKALEILRNAGLDAIKIDLKGNAKAMQKYNKANIDFVWRNAKKAKDMGLHIEVVYLMVTKATDQENMVLETIERHLKDLGPDTPLHFTRYFPAYQYTEPPTSVKKLEWAYEMAKKMGVRFPYIGNVAGHPYENTYCPECNEVLIKRFGARILRYKITENRKCPNCGCEIPIVGKHIRKIRLFM